MKKILLLVTLFFGSASFSLLAQNSSELQFIDVEPIILEFTANNKSLNLSVDSNIVYKVNSVLVGSNNNLPASITLAINGVVLINKCSTYYDGSKCSDFESKLPYYINYGEHNVYLRADGLNIYDYSIIKLELNAVKYRINKL